MGAEGDTLRADAAPATALSATDWAALATIGLGALALRVLLLPLTNLDLSDHFLIWLDRIRSQGYWAAVSEPFSRYGYTPLYGYLLGAVNALWPPGSDGTVVIKSVSILFDFVAAALMALLAWQRWQRVDAMLAAAAATLFAPTLWLNSAAWGQSDVIYTCFLLAFVIAAQARRAALAALLFGLALATKAQALWLAPFALWLLVQRQLPWRWALVVPLVYVVLALPVVALGRSLWEVLTIYATQAGTQKVLSAGAPNLHFFLDRWAAPWTAQIARAATLLALAASLVYAFALRVAAGRRVDGETLLLAALTSALLVPCLLPYMHERYFFPADLLAIALAVWRPAYWPAALLMQLVSAAAYLPFLTGKYVIPAPVPGWLAALGFGNNMQPYTALQALGALVTLGLLVGLLVQLRRRLAALEAAPPTGASR